MVNHMRILGGGNIFLSTLAVWDLESMKAIATEESHRAGINSLSLHQVCVRCVRAKEHALRHSLLFGSTSLVVGRGGGGGGGGRRNRGRDAWARRLHRTGSSTCGTSPTRPENQRHRDRHRHHRHRPLHWDHRLRGGREGLFCGRCGRSTTRACTPSSSMPSWTAS